MKTSLQLLCVVNAAIFAASISHAATHYVSGTASGTNNGTSWANAYTRLQDALALAASGDQIWIASGTYKPSTTGVRTQSFNVPSGVGLYGGFVGTEATLADRTSAAAATILSGDLLGNDNGNRARTEPTRLDNTYNVVRVNGASSTVTFDGLTIQSGHSETYNDTYDRGGGIHFLTAAAGTVVINNCIIRWNTARGSAGWADDCNHAFTVSSSLLFQNQAESGGAAGFGAAFTIRNCGFVQNRTENSRDGYQWGGGLFIANGTGLVINCVFASNYAAEEGGAVYNHGNASFINCTFFGNSAVRWSSALHDRTNSASVRNCIFWGNTGTTYPISAEGGSPGTPVFNSLVQGGYTAGGAASIISSDPLFTNNASAFGFDGRLGTADDGLRLGPGSPAINAGNNAYVPAGTTMDISGAMRISGTVDMGAYETLPVITTQPQSITVAQNAAASFSVTATGTGTGTLSYQWQKDSVDIPGATSSNFTLASAKPWHIGDYTVKITDNTGTVTSSQATLSLTGIISGIWRGLVAYYPFNSNLTSETTGLGQSLTNFQTTQGTDRFGAGNAAASFSVAQSSRLTSTTFFPIRGAGAKTVSAWIKYNGGTPQPWNEGTIVRWGGDNVTFGSVFEFRVASMDSLPGTSLCLDGGGNVTQGNQAIDTSAWRHVVIVNPENSGINDPDMWVDGVLLPKRIGSDPNYFFDTQGLQTLTIGGAPDNSRFFEGSIDDVRIYNRTLNPGDISALYAAENASNVWRQTHFGSTARTGSAADNEDPDKDGMPNLLEYALNLPPNAASRATAAVQAAGGNLEYTYTRGTAAYNGGTTFQVEWSDDLTTWSSAGVVETLVSDDGTTQQVKSTLPAGSGGRRFVRLRVQ